jgi:hypothetical protein
MEEDTKFKDDLAFLLGSMFYPKYMTPYCRDTDMKQNMEVIRKSLYCYSNNMLEKLLK